MVDFDDGVQDNKECVDGEEGNGTRSPEPSTDKDALKDEPAISATVALKSESKVEIGETDKVKGRLGYRFIKRTFDIISSAVAIILTILPILICLIIKWIEDANKKYCKLEIREVEGDGKERKNRYKSKDGKFYECKVVKDPERKHKGKRAPIYSSIRVGKDGKNFKFYKIRSMYPGAEDMKQQLIDAGLNEADEPAFKIKNDPRITPFGNFLRKSSFDELPQLFNIFIGKMSVVGPRPPLPDEVKKYTLYQKQRLKIKGGLLCLWQIQENKNSLSFDEWVELDIKYINERSVWLDLKIIFKMIKNIFTGGGYNS